MAVERYIDLRIRLKGADQVRKGLKALSDDLGNVHNWLDVTKGILGSAIIRKGFWWIVNGLKDATDASIDFESALAGVAKTTDFSDVGLQDFGNKLMELSQKIPTTAAELAGLAEIAGQLGIAKEDILEFTEVVAAMGVSTNVSAEEAATAFARIANIFGTASEDYSRLGSAVVDLGNNFATTETEILDMQKNMSGMAALVGMTEADVLAFATALSSIGVEAEAGGSAMQRLFQNMEMAVAGGTDAVELFANAASMSSAEFENLWKTDPAQAVNRFVVGLKDIDESGGNTLEVLDELEIKEIRLIRAVLGLANADTLLGKALEMSREAWKENTALTEEAGKRYETTASRIQIAQNKIDNAQITIGDGLKGLKLTAKDTLGDIAANWNEQARAIDLAAIIDNATAAYEAEQKAIDNTAQSAKFLADALESMGSPETLDAAGQREYVATMTALIDLVPEINRLWNAETMTIEGGTDAIYRNIDAVREMEKAEAQLSKSREITEAYSIIEEAVAAQHAQLAILKADLETAEKAYDDFVKSVPTDVEASGITMDGKALAEEAGQHKARIKEAEAAVNELQSSISAGEKILSKYSYVVTEFEENTERTVSAYTNLSAATEGISESQKKAVAGLEYINAAIDEAMTEYQAAEEKILETINNIADGFSEFEMPEISPPEETLKSMDSQLEFLEAYSDALEKAKDMGVDENIIAQLATGTEADYKTLASIVSGTEEDVETINAKYAEISAAKTTLAEELATAQTDMASTVNSVTDLANQLVDGVDVSTDMYAAGAEDIQNLIDGINSKINALRLTTGRVRNITSAMSGTPDIDGSHAAGLAYVPHDGYIAQLHKGEMVLTALAAKAYRAEQTAGYAIPAAMDRVSGRTSYSTTNNYTNNISGFGASGEELDADLLAEKIARANRRKARGRGYT